MKHYKSLDGVRGVALLLVMANHYHISYFAFAWFALPLFFVLSGYLITNILLEQKEQPAKKFFKNFYIRRALRIFPLYYGYIAIIFSVPLLSKQVNSHEFFSLLTYTYNFTRISPHWKPSPFYSAFWSLCVEEHFYLLWPFIVYFLTKRNIGKVLIFFIILAPLSRYLLAESLTGSVRTPHMIGDAVYRFTLSHFDAFSFGALVALFRLDRIIKRPKIILSILTISIIALGVSLSGLHQSILTKNVTFGFPNGSLEHGRHIWSYTLLNLFAMMVVIVSITDTSTYSVWNRIFSNKILVYCGKVSYSAYVLHGTVMYFYRPVFLVANNFFEKILFFLLHLTIVFILASISYYGYERYFLKMKTKFNR